MSTEQDVSDKIGCEVISRVEHEAQMAAAKAIHDIYHHTISERPTDVVMSATINIVRDTLALLRAAGIQIEEE